MHSFSQRAALVATGLMCSAAGCALWMPTVSTRRFEAVQVGRYYELTARHSAHIPMRYIGKVSKLEGDEVTLVDMERAARMEPVFGAELFDEELSECSFTRDDLGSIRLLSDKEVAQWKSERARHRLEREAAAAKAMEDDDRSPATATEPAS